MTIKTGSLQSGSRTFFGQKNFFASMESSFKGLSISVVVMFGEGFDCSKSENSFCCFYAKDKSMLRPSAVSSFLFVPSSACFEKINEIEQIVESIISL